LIAAARSAAHDVLAAIGGLGFIALLAGFEQPFDFFFGEGLNRRLLELGAGMAFASDNEPVGLRFIRKSSCEDGLLKRRPTG